MDNVLIEVHAGVALLTLNRPERLNAWTPQLQTRYFDLLEECAARTDVRAIVVTGAGRGFCAGADMHSLQALVGAPAGPDAAAGDEMAHSAGDGALDGAPAGDGTPSDRREPASDDRSVRYPLSIPKPVIAAINGPCAGIGLVLALMCDLRFAAAQAKITTAFVRRGLVAEHGIAWLLVRLVGPAHALDLLLSGRVVRGSEAAQLGLVNRATETDVLDEALAYARELATECSPASMAVIKRQVYSDLERSLAGSVDEANRLMTESFGAPDFAEGVQSFVERRPPRFAPLGN